MPAGAERQPVIFPDNGPGFIARQVQSAVSPSAHVETLVRAMLGRTSAVDNVCENAPESSPCSDEFRVGCQREDRSFGAANAAF
jgi:hypothetical protein